MNERQGQMPFEQMSAENQLPKDQIARERMAPGENVFDQPAFRSVNELGTILGSVPDIRTGTMCISKIFIDTLIKLPQTNTIATQLEIVMSPIDLESRIRAARLKMLHDSSLERVLTRNKTLGEPKRH